MGVKFTLPRSFYPLDVLPPGLFMRADDARYLVSEIVRKAAARDTDVWGFARLHHAILNRVIENRTRAKIVRALVEGGVIETAPHFPGVKSKGYKLTDRFLQDTSVVVPATDPKLIRRIK